MPRTKKTEDTSAVMMETAATQKSDAKEIVINPIHIETATVTIIGDSPLIVHAWGEKAKREMLESQKKQKKDKKARPVRDEFAEFMDALYWLTPKPEEHTREAFEEAIEAGAKFGFPTIAIKDAALAASYRAGIIPNQVGMKCAFRLRAIEGADLGTGSELCVIDTDEPPRCREDMVKIGGISKVADLRYRPEFRNWRMRLKIELIQTGTFSMSSIINALNMGGFMNGIGEWRMERDGDFGAFHVQIGEE